MILKMTLQTLMTAALIWTMYTTVQHPTGASIDRVASITPTDFADRDGIATAQRTDPLFASIITALESTAPSKSTRNECALSGGLLVRLPNGSTPGVGRALLCVPQSMINALFDQYHNAPMGDHFNGLRTYEKLRISYYWPKMGQQIFARCESCHACQSARPRKPDNSGHMTSTPPSGSF
jgi:Integrase zinc binding domain